MTYADFITLLMIFFIVLYTFTPGVEKSKFEAIIGVFQGKRGVLKYDSVFSDEILDIEIQRAKNWEELQRMIDQKKLGDQIQIDLMPDGIRIILGETITFKTYSAELIPPAKEILQEIIVAIINYKNEDLDQIEIHGHTDSRPIRKNAYKYKSNWELGAARAISVLHFMVANTSLPSSYFQAATYGEFHPRANNDTPQGMKQNRRVEIHIKYEELEQSDNKYDKIKKLPATLKDLDDGKQ